MIRSLPSSRKNSRRAGHPLAARGFGRTPGFLFRPYGYLLALVERSFRNRGTSRKARRGSGRSAFDRRDLEKIARAIARAELKDVRMVPDMPDLPQGPHDQVVLDIIWQDYLPHARAAAEAMKRETADRQQSLAGA